MEGQLLRLVDGSARKEGLSRNSLVTSILARNFNQLGLTHRESIHLPPNTEETIRKGLDTTERNITNSAAATRRENQELRKRVMAGYGGRCACCGEDRIKFLNVDHVNGKDGRRGSRLLRFIINHGFPPYYRILCFNCKMGRELNGGVCPHSV
ncbi:MAG: hypothetical protein LYZ66_00230 [Nitrososphaerales archaeon]|nr:hypothetical protein [Nitrososphaerales archaeon]